MGWGLNGGISGGIVSGVLDALRMPWQHWLDQHPQMGWLLANPGWLLALLVLGLFLLAGLLRAVASLTEKLWLGLLRLPILLVQWLWQGSLLLMFSLRRLFVKSSQAVQSPIMSQPEPVAKSRSERLAEVLERLESLRREQDELMQEVKSFLEDGRQKPS